MTKNFFFIIAVALFTLFLIGCIDDLEEDSVEENKTFANYNLYAEDWGTEDVYGAFANHYALMYEDFSLPDQDGDIITIQSPFSLMIADSCNSKSSCERNNIFVKSWIPGYTDTTTNTAILDPSETVILPLNYNFNDEALLSITSAQKTQRKIEAYVLKDNQRNLFYSTSQPVTIHPMQVFGESETYFLVDDSYKYYWYSLWVTPMADSISRIVNEVAKKLPNGQLLVYQQYSQDKSIEQSSIRVIRAVFEVLQSRNIKYIENTGAASLGQRVNYPVETLRKRQGICIETATLFASVLERLGFQTHLIFIPGHVFVGWLSERNGNSIDLIESTMIGYKNVDYADAINKGRDEYNEQIQLGMFESGESMIVDIELARQMGIVPNNIP